MSFESQLRFVIVAAMVGLVQPDLPTSCAAERPNVLWITLEDMSPNLGCYGDPDAVTPNMDRLAEQGVRYTRASSNAGMCSIARATLITGMYPPSIGALHMRSEVLLPPRIRAYPEFLRRAGYFCSNHSKTDYNWIAPTETWDVNSKDWRGSGWRRREPGQPFFTVINITDTHSSQLYYRGEKNWRRRYSELPASHRHDPNTISVPPYYPDTPEVRGDLAHYHDNISFADQLVGQILAQLDEDGLAEDTIVFLYSDHGMGMPRAKSWCFESSLRVPLIIRFPERWQKLAPGKPGSSTDRMVSFVDFAPTLLTVCGVEQPEQFQGQAFLGPDIGTPRRFQFTYRDRMDERYELIRGINDGRFKYIRNFLPHLPWFHHQTRLYPALQPTYQVWHELSNADRLTGPPADYMANRKPREQLFDLESDPHETVNLIDDERYAERHDALRKELYEWILHHRDLGFMPESAWESRFAASDGQLRPALTILNESPDEYPLQRILDVADLVGSGEAAMTTQVQRCRDSDPSVRYWSAVGLLAQSDISSAATNALIKLLDDDVPSCRIAAAETLLHHDVGDRKAAVERLVEVAASDNYYARLLAINSLHRTGDRIRNEQAEPLRFLIARKPADWIDRSIQSTVWTLLTKPQ